MKICQVCASPLSEADLAADPYVRLCLNCWHGWEIEAGQPLRRYGKPGGKSVCVACGMVFGGVSGYDRHRREGGCLSPAELRAQNQPMIIKDGVWVREPLANAFISKSGSDSSHFPEVPATLPLPDAENAYWPLSARNLSGD